MKTKQAVLWSVVAVVVILGILPVAGMLCRSLIVDGQLSLAHYRSVFSPRSLFLLGQSLRLSAAVTVISSVVGIPMGIILSRTDVPLRRLWSVMLSLPFLLPPYLTAFCWSLLLGRGGLAEHLLGPSLSGSLFGWFFGFPGCVTTLATAFMPIVMLLTMTYAVSINPHLEEAGRTFAPWWRVITEITLPMIRPAILLGVMLVFLLTLGEFSVPMFFRYEVFPVESFVQFSAFYSFGAATAAAIPLVLVTFLILLLERLFLLEKTYQVRPAGSEAALPIGLGRLRWGMGVAISLFTVVSVVFPLFTLLLSSGSVAIYGTAIMKAGGSLLRSVLYAAIGASVLVVVGFFTGYLIHNRTLKMWRGLDTFTLFLFALPAPVIGIGLVSLWNHGATNFIYGSFLIIIFGYGAQYMALTSRITLSALSLIPPSMEEAAQIAGAGWLRRMVLIVAPLIEPGLVTGWLVAYIFCLRDVGITMMVYPPGGETLPVRTFTLMANNPVELIAALCVIMMAATLIPLGAIGILRNKGRKLYGAHRVSPYKERV